MSIEGNAYAEINEEEYETKYAALAEKYETLKGKCAEANERILRRKLKANRIAEFFKTLESSDLITEFDEGLCKATVDTMTVYSKKKIVLKLKDGTEVEWHVSNESRRSETRNYISSSCGLFFSFRAVAYC